MYTASITSWSGKAMIRLLIKEVAEKKKISQSKLGRLADV